MSGFSRFIELTDDSRAIPPEADLLLEVNSYTWMASSKLLCHHSEFFKIACTPDRFQEGRERRVTIREAKPWTVARVIHWCYSQTFDRVCTNKIPPEQSEPELPQTLQQVTDSEAYELDFEEDALTPTYTVSAEVYELAHRLFMPELCKYIATEMLERYRPLMFTSWPPAVFDTLARASTDNPDFRAMLCEALAIQTFLEPPARSRSLRLRSLTEDDPEFIFELMHHKDLLNQTFREKAKRLTMVEMPDQMLMLEMEISGQYTQVPRRLMSPGKEPVTWQWGHVCAGVPVLNICSGRTSYWFGHGWIERDREALI